MIAYLAPTAPETAPATPLAPDVARFADANSTTPFRAGATEGCAELMNLYRQRLYAFAFRLTRNHHDAEDVVQETFLRAFRAASTFRGDAALSSWLYVIARNIVHNRYWSWRRRKGDVTVSLDSPAGAGDAERQLTAFADERAECERHELERCIAEGIARLPENDRIILQMRTRDHASYLEIARTLGLGMGTVKSRLARARERLRVLVHEAQDGEARQLRRAS